LSDDFEAVLLIVLTAINSFKSKGIKKNTNGISKIKLVFGKIATRLIFIPLKIQVLTILNFRI
jgi:hypothetical protein